MHMDDQTLLGATPYLCWPFPMLRVLFARSFSLLFYYV